MDGPAAGVQAPSAAPAAAPEGALGLEAAVGAVLDDLTTFRIRFWAPILLGLIMLFDSWDSIAIAYAMPSVSAEWRLSPITVGLLISAGYCGQFLGAILLGGLAERFGRMPVLIASVSAMAFFALASVWAPGFAAMAAIRLAEGLMIGGALPVSVTYINELAPTRTRGRYFMTFQFLAMAGYAAASLSSAWVVPHLGWRWLLGLGAAPAILVPLAALTLPESPRWLARLGRLEAANRALAKLGGGPAPAVSITDLRPPPATPERRPTVLVLFRPPLLGRTLVVGLLWFFAAFANFGLTTWIPSIYVSVFHVPVAASLRYASFATVGFLIVTPFAGMLMDRIGRRPIAIAGALTAAITLLALAIHRPASEGVLVAAVVAGTISISAVMFILWPYTAEIYPTPVRALGLGLGSSVARGASMLTPLVAGVILGTGASIAIVFAVYGLCALGALGLWLFFTQETARKALHAI